MPKAWESLFKSWYFHVASYAKGSFGTINLGRNNWHQINSSDTTRRFWNFLLLHLFILCVHVWVYVPQYCMCGGQRSLLGVSSLSTLWVTVIEPRSSGLVANGLTSWVILPAPGANYPSFYSNEFRNLAKTFKVKISHGKFSIFLVSPWKF